MRTFGVDTGGTFTDVVLLEGGEPRVAKVHSTPADPAQAVVEGLRRLGGAGADDHVVHGTTVALNALLTGRTARAALVTGAGFADLLEIDRQDRPELYDLEPRKPPPLVPRRLRFEIGERSWPDPAGGGLVRVQRASAEELAELARRVARSGAESVAVCLLHSWADPGPEEEVARALAGLGIPVTTSAGVLPEHREVERFSTAVVNAALIRVVRGYLEALEARLPGARLSVLQSSGGTLPAGRAAVEPVRVLLSGPAGGVVGAARAAREAGFARMVALDMGGTSTDVAFHDGGHRDGRGEPGAAGAAAAARAVEPLRVGGRWIAVPSLDIHTIGCGGGSLARVDAGGVLHVGPESAGADPGPVCYGRSDVPTVTDAHVLLGHVAEGPFLEGGLALDRGAVQRAFERLAARLGTDPVGAARAVLAVARAGVRRALSVMTMQRGEDPRRLPLVAFGGAGGLSAAWLAGSLGMPAALVPRHPGALSALGMARAEASVDLALSPVEPLSLWPPARRRRAAAELACEGRARLAAAGHRARDVAVETRLDRRYRGQGFEIRLPDPLGSGGPGGGRGDAAEAFHRAHERLYGWRLDGREIELVCLRARARAVAPEPMPARPRARPLPARAARGRRRIVLDRPRTAAVVDRAALAPGHRFEGPALVEEYSGTTLVPPGWRVRVTAGSHLLLEPPRGR